MRFKHWNFQTHPIFFKSDSIEFNFHPADDLDFNSLDLSHTLSRIDDIIAFFKFNFFRLFCNRRHLTSRLNRRQRFVNYLNRTINRTR